MVGGGCPRNRSGGLRAGRMRGGVSRVIDMMLFGLLASRIGIGGCREGWESILCVGLGGRLLRWGRVWGGLVWIWILILILM